MLNFTTNSMQLHVLCICLCVYAIIKHFFRINMHFHMIVLFVCMCVYLSVHACKYCMFVSASNVFMSMSEYPPVLLYFCTL